MITTMTNKEELKAKIEKIKKGLENPEIADNLKMTMREGLANAEKELAALSAPAPTRTEAYKALLAEYPELNSGNVGIGKTYGGHFDKAVASLLKMGYTKAVAEEMAEVFLNTKLPAAPKAEKPEPKPAKAQVFAAVNQKKGAKVKTVKAVKTVEAAGGKHAPVEGGKVAVFPGAKVAEMEAFYEKAGFANVQRHEVAEGKFSITFTLPTVEPKPAKPAKKQPAAPAAEPATSTSFDWMHKVPGWENARQVRLKTPFFVIEVEADGHLTTRGAKVPLKKGDFLLLNEEGYPMTFFTPKSAEGKVVSFQEMVTRSHFEEVRDGLQAKLDQAGPVAQQARSKPAAAPAQTPAPTAAPAHKGHTCTREESEVMGLTGAFYDWLENNKWDGLLESLDVLKVVYTKGEKAHFLVQTKNYKLFGRNRSQWHRICPETWKMTAVAEKDWPKPGSYKLLLSEQDIRKAKTTRGPKMFGQCLAVYRKFAECSKDGTCNAEDRDKISKAWHTCGDLTLKTDKLPKWMELLYEKVRKEKRANETFPQAMHRIASQGKH